MLERIAGEAPDGLPRLRSGRGAGAVGPVPGRQPQAARRGPGRLEAEIARQILPDGGHVSRSPEALLAAYRHLVMVMDALSASD